jgi:hypothetical protein
MKMLKEFWPLMLVTALLLAILTSCSSTSTCYSYRTDEYGITRQSARSCH